MKKSHIIAQLVGACLALLVAAPAAAGPAPASKAHTETAVLAGGCFWGLEAVFERLRGVSNVVSGFAGGNALTAHYEIVSTGTTGHAESVQITYDPAQISYATLLKVYFTVATDPTQLNRQGPDEGTQYRSEIFYTTPEQQQVAQTTIAALTAAHAYAAPIVTKVEPLRGFYPAEAYHQHFYDRNPTYPYIVYNDKPKVDQLHAKFPQLVKAEN
ncbi:MAG: peptide-methionine (S)-S-oxide reductase MsrA [Candidatus Velthaea sp.]|jgi:peptide-methionine (S)-S-oxide reductase